MKPEPIASMSMEGTLKTWNDDRGFGFIQPNQGGAEVFVHIKAFKSRNVRPQVNQCVYFEIELDPQGRPQARNVEFSRAQKDQMRQQRDAPASLSTASFLAIPAFVFLFGLVSLFWQPPLILAGIYLVTSIFTLVIYAMDKSAAKKGAWRISESSLHWLSLIGGWPGALIGQHLLRHKSNKAPFRFVFWITVFVNIALFIALASPQGQVHWVVQ